MAGSDWWMCAERKRQVTAASSELEKKDEEEWPMKDVVLVEDVKTVPIGKVLKVQRRVVSLL